MKDNNVIIQTSTENKVKDVGMAQPRFFDFMISNKTNLALDSSSFSSSSSSSSVTEVSSSGAEHEEGSAWSSC